MSKRKENPSNGTDNPVPAPAPVPHRLVVANPPVATIDLSNWTVDQATFGYATPEIRAAMRIDPEVEFTEVLTNGYTFIRNFVIESGSEELLDLHNVIEAEYTLLASEGVYSSDALSIRTFKDCVWRNPAFLQLSVDQKNLALQQYIQFLRVIEKNANLCERVLNKWAQTWTNPTFPPPHKKLIVLCQKLRDNEDRALEMVLEKMATSSPFASNYSTLSSWK